MTTFVVDDPMSSPPPQLSGTPLRHEDATMVVATASAAEATSVSPHSSSVTPSSAATLFVVQKCWLDGPRFAKPVDCGRLWTTSEAATQFAHASANQYAAIVQQRKLYNSGRISSQQQFPTVRTLLLDNHQYGFATSGRLFWVRAVHVPLCSCWATNTVDPNNSLVTATTALVRLHQGVMGGMSANGGRRGTEDVYNCARLDCPKNCLQAWISSQLSTHQACSWLRVPVGNALYKSMTSNNDDWWKEQWSDWETWGGGGNGSSVTATTSAVAAAGAVHTAADFGTTGAVAHHKRRSRSWGTDDSDLNDDVAMDDGDGEPTTVTMASSESTWHGQAMPTTGTASSTTPRGRLVTEDHHQHHQQNVVNHRNWFAPSSVDYASNKRSAGAHAATANAASTWGMGSSSSMTMTTGREEPSPLFGAAAAHH